MASKSSAKHNAVSDPVALKRAAIYLRVSTARQAGRGGEAEGYSIPAQRDACRRKAEDLGASVVDEYVDAGASARSADRPALQALLKRLSSSWDLDYVIVHKVDRLARDRAGDVAIGLAIHKAGAVLVSASEQIDDTPAGTLLHGMMATIAEFYSRNLAAEVKKGLLGKVQAGGTPGYAPLGYLNVTTRVDGQEVRSVEFDLDRAEHVVWAFQTYAGGDHSITDLVGDLAKRGMKTRGTTTRPAVPMTRSQVHRMLSSSYYIGKLTYSGVEYAGKHPALIDVSTWHKVKVELSRRRLAGDRAWKHDPYLKGSLFCTYCDSRLGYGISTGKLGEKYPYYYCLGRNKKWTDCQLHYIPVDRAELFVARHWKKVKLSSKLVQHTRIDVHEELASSRSAAEATLKTQRRRLLQLDKTRQKLIDAYLADAIPVADLKVRQEALSAEQREAERLIELSRMSHDLAEERVELALRLMEHCERLYLGSPETTRQTLNQVFFDGLYLNERGVVRAELNQPFALLKDRSIGFDDEDQGPDNGDGARDGPERGPDGPQAAETSTTRRSHRPTKQKNPRSTGSQGSDLTVLAEGVGFRGWRDVSPGQGLFPPSPGSASDATGDATHPRRSHGDSLWPPVTSRDSGPAPG